TGAVGEKNAIGFERQDVVGGGERRDNGYVAAGVDQTAEDVLFDAEIVGDDIELRLGRRRDDVRGRAGVDGLRPVVVRGSTDAAGEIEARHGRNGAGFLH